MSLKWQKYKRLLVRKDYQACYNLGEKYFTKLFVIFVKPSQLSRVGMAVSKKSGNAVARNRIKRVLREFFRLNQALLPLCDFVIVPKRHVQAKRIRLISVEKDLIPFLHKIRQ